MASALSQNPIIVDVQSPSLVMTSTINVLTLILTAPTANATYQLKDANANTMFEHTWIAGATTIFTWPQQAPLVLDGGFSVNSCSAGRIMLYRI